MNAHHLSRRRASGRPQRGAVALFVTVMLFLAMLISTVFVNRNLVFEQRISANQYRSTRAFEAAEAGLAWAVAQLNNPQRLDSHCLPTTDPSATSFRARYLSFTRVSASFMPTTLQASCVRSGASWSCSCPMRGPVVLEPPAEPAPAVAFTVQFLPADKPGAVRVAATGCTQLAGTCQPGSTTPADATAKLEVTLGLLPGLRTAPVAPLTTRGAVNADTVTLGLHNADPATGVALHAGGRIAASQARLTVPAGASTAGTLIGNDANLSRLDVDRFFTSTFGLDKERWKNQPGATRIDCQIDCSRAVRDAIAATADSALIWLEGDLTLAGPMTLGSVERPVVIVVSGAARLEGAVTVFGVLYAADIRWDHTGGGAMLRGSALSEGGYAGDGAPDFVYDPAVLATLTGNSGSFARVSGSWRDF